LYKIIENNDLKRFDTTLYAIALTRTIYTNSQTKTIYKKALTKPIYTKLGSNNLSKSITENVCLS